MTQNTQNKLNDYCLILRKYKLMNQNQFILEFPNIKLKYLEIAWIYSFEEIQNREIITNPFTISSILEKKVENRLLNFNFKTAELFYYLNSKFDVKELKLDDEKIERRLRNILAKRHQELLKKEIVESRKKDKIDKVSALKDKILSGFVTALIPLIIVGFLFGSKIRDGLTSVETLTERIYEREVYKHSGSVCNDGSISSSQGRGTCSWHGGVKYKFYKGQHKKTRSECRIEAKEQSWLE